MDDQEFLATVKQASTPREILVLILEYENLLGYDPYFGHLRKAMLNQARQVLGQVRPASSEDRKLERTRRRARNMEGWTCSEWD